MLLCSSLYSRKRAFNVKYKLEEPLFFKNWKKWSFTEPVSDTYLSYNIERQQIQSTSLLPTK